MHLSLVRNGTRKAAALLLTAAMLIGNIGGTNTVQAAQPSSQGNITQTGQMAGKEICGEGYQVILRQQNVWDNGSQVEIEVKNTGSRKLKNWDIRMKLAKGTISNAWSVENRNEDGMWYFISQEHNRIIAPGASVIFGCQLEGARLADIKELEYRQRERVCQEEKQYEIAYTVVNEWDGHASIEAEIRNRMEKDMEDWQLDFCFQGEIKNIWNADILSHAGNHYEIENKEYNAIIPSQGSVKFGFEAEYKDGSITLPQTERLESAGEGMVAPTAKPTVKPSETPTNQPKETPEPTHSSQPAETEKPETDTSSEEDFNPEEDIWVYHDIENRDWNMEMIHADSAAMKEERQKERGAVRVALLDSGVNYSDEVYVSERKNFVPGQDDYSELYEDVSGHGTAVAEILASNPNGEKVPVDVSMEEDGNEYIYYDEAGNEIKPEDEVEEEEPLQKEGTLLALLRSGYEWNEGVNPGVDLISAKVLDENNETTVDRVVAAIDWAIENEADILNMSFGMEQDSEKLHKAVKKAYDSGLLLIASAGNDGKVEYPAAYPEVVAVGSVDSLAEQAEQSAEGKEVEVVAPGEFIVSRGVFDSMQIFSGTSMAVPHVTGLASVLWEKDTSKPADFIRQLIAASARTCGRPEECGYGLIDCEFALENYDEFAEQYTGKQPEMADSGELVVQMENEEAIDTDEDVRELYGSWGWKEHVSFVSEYAKEHKEKWGKMRTELDILTKAVTFVDSTDHNPQCQGMHKHPWFHGYYGKKKFKGKKTPVSNYVASYYYLYYLARQMYQKGELCFVDIDDHVFPEQDNEPLKTAYKGIEDAFGGEDKIGNQTWEQICGKKKVTKEERSLVLFGMALHTLTDTYAHSSYGIHKRKEPVEKGSKKKKLKLYWDAVTHDTSHKKAEYADNIAYINKRHRDAKAVADRLMKKVRIEKEKGVFIGFDSEKTALDVYLQQEDSPRLKRLINRKVKDVTKINKEYGLRAAYDYVRQVRELVGDGLEKTSEVLEKIEVIDNKKVQKRLKETDIVIGLPKKKKSEKKNIRSSSASPKETYDLYDMDTGDKLMTIHSDGTPYMLAVDEGCRCRVMLRRADGTNRLCYYVSGGRVYDAASGEIPETFWEDDEEELEQMPGEEDDEEEKGILQDIYAFEYKWYESAYRVELTWENGGVDLDLLLMAMFPYEDEFYVTCIREKTANPELGDVFQSDPAKASLDRDVQDASGAETIFLHNMEEDGLYLFFVRNFSKKTEEQLKDSGAILRVYRRDETEPFATLEVPEGEGYYWNAFYLVGDIGEIIPIGTITDEVTG